MDGGSTSSTTTTTASGGVAPAWQSSLRPARPISSVVARPLSLLSTRSLHRRESATDGQSLSPPATTPTSLAGSDADPLASLPAGSRASFSGSTRNSKRDSRGLLAAQVELNFEEALLRTDTVRLSSSSPAPSGETHSDGLRSSLERSRSASRGQGATLREEDGEELLADLSTSTVSTVDLGTLAPGDVEIDSTEGDALGAAGSAAAVDGAGRASSSDASKAASPPLLSGGSPTTSATSRLARKPPPSAFSPPSSPGAEAPARLASPRPSLSSRDESAAMTPPSQTVSLPVAHPTSYQQPGIIPSLPMVQPPTPGHSTPDFGRRPSDVPALRRTSSGNTRSVPAVGSGDIPRTRSSLDLASLVRPKGPSSSAQCR